MGDPAIAILDDVIARAAANSTAPMGVTSDVCLRWLYEARRQLATRARPRPVIYVSVSGGIADFEVYGDQSLVRVVHIDWDNVEGESGLEPEAQFAVNDVRDLLEVEELPERLRADIKTSLDRALRWEQDTERAPYAHE